MNASELRELDSAGLRERLIQLRREQLQLRLAQAAGQDARTHRFQQLRREIARIKTVMRQSSASGQLSASEQAPAAERSAT